MAKPKVEKIKLIVTFDIKYQNGNEREQRIKECKNWARRQPDDRPWELRTTNATLFQEAPKPKKVSRAQIKSNISKLIGEMPTATLSEIQEHLKAQREAGVPFSEAKLLPEGRTL
jgi:hypothetical protein